MSSPLEDPLLLPRLVGTQVTTYDDTLTEQAPFPRTWVITKKQRERAFRHYATETAISSTPITVGKYLCHPLNEPAQICIMKVWYQIPLTGTTKDDVNELARQAAPPPWPGELKVSRVLTRLECDAVPRLLGHIERVQGANDLVPGGWIRYVVWEKVPGESLTDERFWDLDSDMRRLIRKKFKAAYMKVLACGVSPPIADISRIILDLPRGTLHIAGFWGVPDKPQADERGWKPTQYLHYGLPNERKDAPMDPNPDNWEW